MGYLRNTVVVEGLVDDYDEVLVEELIGDVQDCRIGRHNIGGVVIFKRGFESEAEQSDGGILLELTGESRGYCENPEKDDNKDERKLKMI